MKVECAKNVIDLHQEIEEIATASVAFAEAHILPYLTEAPSDYDLKQAINQTVVNMRRLPDALMAELVKHTREKLKH